MAFVADSCILDILANGDDGDDQNGIDAVDVDDLLGGDSGNSVYSVLPAGLPVFSVLSSLICVRLDWFSLESDDDVNGADSDVGADVDSDIGPDAAVDGDVDESSCVNNKED
jgi:hypothetical protein